MARNNMFPARANGTIAPATFVKFDTSGPNLVVQAGAGDPACGISQVGQKRAPGLAGSNNAVAAEQGDPIQVWGIGDVCPLTAGTGGWTAGDPLKSDGSGNGILATGANIVCAHAIQTVVAGAQGLVQICSPTPLS